MHGPPRIRPATVADVPKVIEYLADHVSDNGVGITPLFMPQARGASLPARTLDRFRAGLDLEVGSPGWMRLWLVWRDEQILAHCDLSALGSAYAAHRAILGMGVDRNHRRQGLGQQVMQVALSWAEQHASLAWVDLDVLASNPGARRLYERLNFELVAEIRDAFVVDGESVARVMMTRSVSTDSEKSPTPH